MIIKELAAVEINELADFSKGHTWLLENAVKHEGRLLDMEVHPTEGFKVSVEHEGDKYWSDYCETYFDAAVDACGKFLSGKMNVRLKKERA